MNEPLGPRLSRHDLIFLCIIVLTVTALRFYGATSQSLWLDEINVIRLAQYPDLATFYQYAKFEPHPPLFLLLMRYWTGMFGYSELALRSLSIIVSIVVLPFFYLLLKRRTDAPTAALTTALLAFAPVAELEAHNTRPYTLLMALGALALPYFLDVCRAVNGAAALRGRSLAALLALNAVCALTHYAAAFFILTQCLVLFALYCVNPRRRLGADFSIIVVVGLSIAPGIAWFALHYFDVSARIAKDATFNQVGIRDYTSPFSSLLGRTAYLPVLLLPLVVAFNRPRAILADFVKLFRADTIFGQAFALGVLHSVLIMAVSVVQPSIQQTKFFYLIFPALYLCMARYLIGVSDVGRMLRPVAYLLILVGCATFMLTGYPLLTDGYTAAWRERYRDGARAIAEAAEPGDIVVLGTVSMNGIPIQPTTYYFGTVDEGIRLKPGVKTLILPPKKSYHLTQEQALEERKAAVSEYLQELEGETRRLFFALPHFQFFMPDEIALLKATPYCVRVLPYNGHPVVVVDREPTACLKPANWDRGW